MLVFVLVPHSTFVSLPSSGELTQKRLQRLTVLRSLSLLRVTRAVCFDSSYLPKIASCSQHQFSLQNHSLPSFPPQRARNVLLTKKSSPAALHHPCPPHNHPPSSLLLGTASPWDALGKLGSQNSSEEVRVTWQEQSSLQSPTGPFSKLTKPSYHILPIPTKSLGKQFMSWWRKVSPSSFLFSFL